jgi:hypothetical protein
MNRVNPKMNASLPDFARALANGLVANGHVVLLVLVCFGVSYMGRGLVGLAEFIDPPALSGQLEELDLSRIINTRIQSGDPVKRSSDQRIDMHRDCTFTEFKAAHREACAAMDRYVVDAISRDSVVR